VALLAAGLLLPGCESLSERVGQKALTPADYAATVPASEQTIEAGRLSYELQPGDQIEIKFYYHPDLNEVLSIGPDNRIALQLIGEIDVVGKTPMALAGEISRRYAPTLRNPNATVILRKYALPRIFVAGEVAKPSAHALEGGRLTALQAIVQSGGFLKGAERRNVVVLRNSGAGKPVFIKLDMQAHLEQITEADLLLKPYDIVFVPQRRIAEVADFFDEYLNRIVPLYRNLGFSFNYNLRNEVEVRQAP
jgi:protein involved in polysaccharide export with SLBB domain